jgi:Leucine-rich repeat (LRR) protein
MKKLFLLLFLGFTLVGFSQTTLIPDPNFEQALIDLGYDTAPINGSVPTANISNVTFLDVRNKNISDLTGIEGFNTLTTLYCFGNQLTSLDVSNNTELNILDCQNNQLTSLDFSGANALTSLSCSLNQLTSLDFNGANALTFLYCDFNPLTSLDVSNNIAWTDLSCTDNQLTSLDLSNNTALTFLFCNRNQLTNLDIRNGNNEALIKIGAGENPNLTCIYVDDADYSNANWSGGIDPASTFVENEAECEALSIGDNALELDVFIYPNPTDNYLFVEGNKNPISISIYNLLGAEVIAKSATDKINVSELSKGVYIIRISDGVNQTNKKFIKN